MDFKLGGRFQTNEVLRNVIVNTGWLFFLRLLRIAFAFFVSVWVTRFLGPERFGILSYAFAFVTLFAPLAKLGLESVVVNEIVQEPSRKGEILGTAFYLRLAGGIICMAIIVAAIMIMQPHDTLTKALTAIVAIGTVFQAFEVIDLWFQAQAELKYPVYARSVALILANVAKIALIVSRAPLSGFAWVATFEAIAGAAGFIVAYRARGSRMREWRATWTMARRLLRLGWPMVLASTFAIVYLKIDQVMLGQMTSREEVGLYSTAVRISEGWYFVPSAISMVVFPHLVRAKLLGEAVYRARLQRLFDFLAAISLAVALVMTFAAHFVIVSLFGLAYEQSAPILAIHIWAGVFVFLREALGRWFVTENLLEFAFISNSIGAAVNVALNFLLIPRYQGIGAAIATVISYAAAGYFACFIHPRTRVAAVIMSRALLVPVRSAAAAVRMLGRGGGR